MITREQNMECHALTAEPDHSTLEHDIESANQTGDANKTISNLEDTELSDKELDTGCMSGSIVSSSVERSINNMISNIEFRSVRESDFREMKALHEEFFPVRYSDAFYRDMVRGIGVQRGQLFSCVAASSSYTDVLFPGSRTVPEKQKVRDGSGGKVQSADLVGGKREEVEIGRGGEEEKDVVLGFALAQVLDYPSRSEDTELFNADCNPSTVCYILTLGVRRQWRRCGLASYFIDVCKQYAASHPGCGALYLHVIHSNAAAIRFYERNGFQRLRTLSGFYHIDGRAHDAYLYIFYTNGCRAPLSDRVIRAASAWVQVGVEFFGSLLAALSRITASRISLLSQLSLGGSTGDTSSSGRGGNRAAPVAPVAPVTGAASVMAATTGLTYQKAPDDGTLASVSHLRGTSCSTSGSSRGSGGVPSGRVYAACTGEEALRLIHGLEFASFIPLVPLRRGQGAPASAASNLPMLPPL